MLTWKTTGSFGMSSTVITPSIHTASKIRRKPTSTYKSPSENDADPLIPIPISVPQSRSLPTQSQTPSTVEKFRNFSRKRQRDGARSLPLYHPLGELALSLPPLIPTDFGLPSQRTLQETHQESSRRSRRFSAKVSDAGEGMDGIGPTVSSIAAVAANEIKRTSPRKKRVNGGNGRRRRKDVDDGDATYPAKRTRQTRTGGGIDNDLDDTPAHGDGASEADGPERRSTRSRARHRTSSEIDSVEGQHTRDTPSPTDDNIQQSTLKEISEERGEEGNEGR